MRKHIFTLMALAAALCACNKEQMIESEVTNPETEPSAPLVFTATMEDAPASKATFDNTAKCASWEIGDQVNIDGSIYEAQSSGTTTIFKKTTTPSSTEIRPSFVSSNSQGFSVDEKPSKLVDDSGVDTKWCANTTHQKSGVWDIVVSTGSAAKLQTIKLWNGNDTKENSGRRWKNVRVSGASSADGDYIVIKTFENLNLASDNYGLAGTLEVNATQEYSFYKIEVLSVESGEIMQMSDMKFVIVQQGIENHIAYFPASLYNGVAALPSAVSETWADGKFNMPMYATSTTTDLAFKNLCGVLKITVKSDQIAAVKNIRVSSANKAVSGTFTVNDNNAAVLVRPSAVINTLKVTYTDAVPTTAEGKVFYVAVPAQTYQKLKIELDADGSGFTKSMTTKAGTNITVERNKIYPITFADNALPLPAGALPGEFSVSDTTKVHFSQGNLQATYDGTKYTWGFAEHQYDYIGSAAGNTTINNQRSGKVVDLFGWSTSATNYGINTSKSDDTYSGDFVDWGGNIGDGNTWRTLTNDEWVYLFDSRSVNGGTGAGNSYSLNITYGGKMGLVLYPDDYTGSILSGTVTTLPDGVVFLPAAGNRSGSGVGEVGSRCVCWSSTAYTTGSRAHCVFYSGTSVSPGLNWNRFYGFSVRLITDVN